MSGEEGMKIRDLLRKEDLGREEEWWTKTDIYLKEFRKLAAKIGRMREELLF